MNGKVLRKVHMVMIALWILLIIPTVVFWSESVLWVAFMSIYACIGFHVEGFQTARVEHKQDKADEANGDPHS